jgi:hypothetical protein
VEHTPKKPHNRLPGSPGRNLARISGRDRPWTGHGPAMGRPWGSPQIRVRSGAGCVMSLSVLLVGARSRSGHLLSTELGETSLVHPLQRVFAVLVALVIAMDTPSLPDEIRCVLELTGFRMHVGNRTIMCTEPPVMDFMSQYLLVCSVPPLT